MKFIGTIGKILNRQVTTRFGKKTFYSLKLDQHEPWISLGTKSPERFQEGDEVEVYAEQDDRGYWNARAIEPVEQSGGVGDAEQPQRVNGAVANVPAPAGRPERADAVVRSAAGATKEAGLGSRGNSGNSGVDRQTSIVLQHSQEMGLRAAALLLEHDGIPMTKASNKAGEAKRFEEIVAVIDKLTVKFYRDAETGRLLETVADMGVVDTSADGPIPYAPAASDSTTDEDDKL